MFNMTPISTNFSASRKYGNNRMIVYSPKLQRQVTVYSNLEYYCYLMLEFDSEIINFCEQPNLMISNYSNNNFHSSIADFGTEKYGGELGIIECKPQNELNSNRVIIQIQTQREWAFRNNFKHKVFTEKDVRNNNILLSNYKHLHTALTQMEDIEQYFQNYNELLRALKTGSCITIEQILKISEGSLSKTNIIPIIATMFHKGEINMNLANNFINLTTEVVKNETGT